MVLKFRLLFLLLFLYTLGTGQPVAVITNENDHLSLGSYVSIYIDNSANLEIEDIYNSEIRDQFRINDQKIVNIGVTESPLWCRIKLKNQSDDDCFLEIRNMALDSVSVYQITDQGPERLTTGGSYVSFNDLEVRYNTFLYKISETNSAEKEFYIRVRHTRGTQFSIFAGTVKGFAEWYHKFDFIQGLYFGFMILMILYNLFLYFSVKDMSYIYYVIYGSCITLLNASLTGYGFEYFWPEDPYINKYQDIFGIILCISGTLFTINFLQTKKNAPIIHKVFIGFMVVFGMMTILVLSGEYMLGTIILEVTSLVLIISFFITAYKLFRKGYKSAKFFLYAWSVLLLGVVLFVLKDFAIVPYNAFTVYSLQIGSALEALLLSFALADRINIYKKEKDEAQLKVLVSLQENEKLILNQNQMLETKVSERTAQLNQSLQNLKNTQAQLIQAEKLASLGELTAGIAHEIQNPLNFVNNFSEVSTEMIDEAEEELEKGDIHETRDILRDLKDNLSKINHHGKRASGIVKNMLEHSRAGGGEKVETDINALCDEYLRLAYHGMRAKERSFNVAFETSFDQSLPKIKVVPQDIGRVLLNLINNAFQAVQDLQGSDGPEGQKPRVEISTKNLADKIEIIVFDNGPGIPEEIRDKIFQPFFTTKPTGQGTGLGLSLSYDIVKAHGGEIHVASGEGTGSSFTIILPAA